MRHLPTVALLCALATPAFAETVTGIPYVTDGDSLRLPGTEVRLEGLDAPEWDQTCRRADGAEYRCGLEAKDALRNLIAGRPVTCVGVVQADGGVRDRYGRLLGRCSVGGVDLAGWMVANGHALAFRRYSVEYVPHEDRARAARLGMWSGEHQAPWDWRASKRTGR